MIEKWETLERKALSDYRIFRTSSVIRKSRETGIKGEFFLVTPPNWIMVIPLLKNSEGQDCFLMVKQYRHGSDSVTLEFPAGMVDPGEVSMDAVIRELSEETGYVSESIVKVGEVNPNPAFMENKTSTYVARDLKKITGQSLDEHEEIETLLVPVNEFDKMVGGPMVNSAITLQAYLFYLRSLSPGVFNFGEGS